jgi:hypothetical protein
MKSKGSSFASSTSIVCETSVVTSWTDAWAGRVPSGNVAETGDSSSFSMIASVLSLPRLGEAGLDMLWPAYLFR